MAFGRWLGGQKNMDLQEIAVAYDKIAARWADVRFNRNDGISQHKRALAFLAAAGRAGALNVGCGCSTRFNELLRQHALRIEGVDVSERMIDLARDGDPTVILHQADICEWIPPRKYRFISAWDSIWHVPLAERHAVMMKLMSSLVEGGVFIFSAGGLDGPDEHTDSTMGPEMYYSTLGIPGIMEIVSEAGCVCRHLEFDQYPAKHLFVIVRKIA
jgi:SAM-dependent methyltransferase